MQITFLESGKTGPQKPTGASLSKKGLFYFSSAIENKVHLEDKNIKVALDKDDPERKFIYIAFLPDNTVDREAKKMGKRKKDGSITFMSGKIAGQILNPGEKKILMQYKNSIKHKEMDFLVFEVIERITEKKSEVTED